MDGEDILSELNQPGQDGQPQGSPAGDPNAPGGAPPADNFNPQEWGYQFRHETVFPKTRQEITELMQLGHSYRTNKQSFEQQRRQVETQASQYQRYAALDQALQQNPDFARELWALGQKFSQPGQAGGAPGQPSQPQGLPPEIAHLPKQVESVVAWQADQELRQELDQVERENPDFDWKADTGDGTLRQQLLLFMRDKQVTDPVIAFRSMMYPSAINKAKFEAQKKLKEDQQKQHRQGIVTSGGAPKPGEKPVDVRGKSYGDMEQLALASLGIK